MTTIAGKDSTDETASWFDEGACKGSEKIFMKTYNALLTPGRRKAGEQDVPKPSRNTLKALNICNAHCNVRRECLEYAIHHRMDWGVWGGTTPVERHNIRVSRGLS